MKSILLLIAGLIFSWTASVAQTPKSNWAALDGHKINYYESGHRKSKKALIFVHGWTCSAEFWSESTGAFPTYRVLAVDLPGHGKSDKPRVDYTMDLFARSVEAVMKKAKVDQAVLVGHSMGTPVSRQFYRLYPQKTLGLVIVDGALRPYLASDVFERFFAPIRADYKKNAPQFIEGMLTPVSDEQLKARIRTAMLATPDYVALSAMDGMGDMRIWGKDQIRVPVLALMAKSPAWKADEEAFFQAVAPHLDFQMWEGVSHFLMMEKPREFNEEIRKFIVKNKLL